MATQGNLPNASPNTGGVWVRISLGLLLAGLPGWMRGAEDDGSKVSPKGVSTAHSIPAQTSAATSEDQHAGESIATPERFLFVGEMWVGPAGYFAITDTACHSSAWYCVGEKVGDYEIVGLEDAALRLRSGSQSLLLPLRGRKITQPEQDASKIPGPESGPTITIWSDGRKIEATPEKMPPEDLKRYNDSKEALLHAKVPAEIEPMVAQALDSKVVIFSGPEGFKRSDFPPEMAAKLDDATLAKINAATKQDREAGKGAPKK